MMIERILHITQDKLHDPDSGVVGNCYTAAICSLLCLQLRDMRQFEEHYAIYGMSCEAGKPDHDASRRCREILAELGWIALGIDADRYPGSAPQGFCIADGPSPRGVPHSVIARDGQVVWDPHPSRDGIEKVEWWEVFVPCGKRSLEPQPEVA